MKKDLTKMPDNMDVLMLRLKELGIPSASIARDCGLDNAAEVDERLTDVINTPQHDALKATVGSLPLEDKMAVYVRLKSLMIADRASSNAIEFQHISAKNSKKALKSNSTNDYIIAKQSNSLVNEEIKRFSLMASIANTGGDKRDRSKVILISNKVQRDVSIMDDDELNELD